MTSAESWHMTFPANNGHALCLEKAHGSLRTDSSSFAQWRQPCGPLVGSICSSQGVPHICCGYLVPVSYLGLVTIRSILQGPLTDASLPVKVRPNGLLMFSATLEPRSVFPTSQLARAVFLHSYSGASPGMMGSKRPNKGPYGGLNEAIDVLSSCCSPNLQLKGCFPG